MTDYIIKNYWGDEVATIKGKPEMAYAVVLYKGGMSRGTEVYLYDNEDKALRSMNYRLRKADTKGIACAGQVLPTIEVTA